MAESEIRILKLKNKILSERCAEYSSNYKALQLKMDIIEYENKLLNESLRKQVPMKIHFDEMCIKYQSLQQSLDIVKFEHDKILHEKHILTQSSKLMKQKLNSQINQLKNVMHRKHEMESKFTDRYEELSKLKQQLNQKHIQIDTLKYEMELQREQLQHKDIEMSFTNPSTLKFTKSETVFPPSNIHRNSSSTLNYQSCVDCEFYYNGVDNSEIHSVSVGYSRVHGTMFDSIPLDGMDETDGSIVSDTEEGRPRRNAMWL